MDLEQLKDEIRQIYGESKRSQKPHRGDTAMVVRPTFKRPFKKECRICGKKGHKGTDCWDLPRNAHKRPGHRGRQTRPEAANITGGYKGPPCDYVLRNKEMTNKRRRIIQREQKF